MVNTVDNSSPGTSVAESFPDSIPAAFTRTSSHAQQLTAARVFDNPKTPDTLETRIERIEDSLEALMTMMGEMQSAINRVAPPANVTQHTYATHSSAESPRHHRHMSRSASSIAVARGVDASELQQQSRQSEVHDNLVQSLKQQRSFRKLWVAERAVNDPPTVNAPSQAIAANVSSNPVQHHPSLKSRLSTVSSSTLPARKRSVVSPTQFTDQLFQAQPRPLFIRHSAESGESSYSLNSSATSK